MRRPRRPTSGPAPPPPRPAAGRPPGSPRSSARVTTRPSVGCGSTTSLLFLLVAGVTGGLLGIEKIDLSGIDVIDADVVGQVFSLHAVAGTFLFLVPLLIGLATYVVPLAGRLADHRLPPGRRRRVLDLPGLRAPPSSPRSSPTAARSAPTPTPSTCSSPPWSPCSSPSRSAPICVATTGIALRAPGMGLHRTPLFTWANVARRRRCGSSPCRSSPACCSSLRRPTATAPPSSAA